MFWQCTKVVSVLIAFCLLQGAQSACALTPEEQKAVAALNAAQQEYDTALAEYDAAHEEFLQVSGFGRGVSAMGPLTPEEAQAQGTEQQIAELINRVAVLEKLVEAQSGHATAIRGEIASGIDASRLADLAPLLAEEQAKLNDAVGKLTDAKQELETLRAGLETTTEDTGGGEPDAASGISRADFLKRIADPQYFSAYEKAARRVWRADHALASARRARSSARERLRWLLHDNEPPFLQVVEVASKIPAYNSIWKGYLHEWGGFTAEDEQLLRLATYLKSDLAANIEMRTAIINEQIPEAKRLNDEAFAKLQTYVLNFRDEELQGAEWWVDIVLGQVSPGYPIISHLALEGFSIRWKRLTIEFVDSGVNVVKPMAMSKVPLAVSLLSEATFRIVDAFTKTANPSWTVEALPAVGEVHYARSSLDYQDEIDLIASIDRDLVLENLNMFTPKLRSLLESRFYHQEIRQRYGTSNVGAQLTSSILLGRSPTFEVPELPEEIDGLMEYAIWSPIHFVGHKTAFRSAINLGLTPIHDELRRNQGKLVPYRGVNPRSFIGKLGIAYAAAQAQAYVRRQALDGLERQRLKLWEDYLLADMHARYKTVWIINEGRLRRVERQILRVIETEIIPELEAKLERRQTREPLQHRDRGVAGKYAKINLVFSRDVVDVKIRVNGNEYPTKKQFGFFYSAEVDLGNLVRSGASTGDQTFNIEVSARDALVEDRWLDSAPQSAAIWDSDDREFAGYTPGSDTTHTFKAAPRVRPYIHAGYSLARESGQLFLNYETGNFLDEGAWIGIFDAGATVPVLRYDLTKLSQGETSIDLVLTPGHFEARVFDSAGMAQVVARTEFEVRPLE